MKANQPKAQLTAELLASIVDSSDDAIVSKDLDGLVTSWNKSAERIFGYSCQEMLGKPISVIANLEFGDDMPGILERIRRGERIEHYETVRKTKNGGRVDVSLTISPVRDASGKIVGASKIARDFTEIKKLRRAREKSDEIYRVTFADAPVGIAHVGLDGRWIQVNQALCKITGYSEEELGARTFADITHPEDLEDARELARRLAAGEIAPFTLERRCVQKHGSIVWVNLTVSVLRDPSGAALNYVAVMEDISARKGALDALRDSELQLKSMVDSIDQLAWMAKADGWIVWYNQRWYEYTGTTPEEMEGWGWHKVHDPEVLPQVMERWSASIRLGQGFDMEFPLRGADGVFRTFLTRIIPVRDAGGCVARWFGTNTNVDVLRKQRDILQRSEKKFRELAEALPDMIWTTDARGNVEYYNSQCHAYAGLTLGDGKNAGWASLLHPDDMEGARKQWEESLATGYSYAREVRLRRYDGAYRWFLSRAVPMENENRRITKWLGTSTDIHEHKLVEEGLRRSNEDLNSFAYAASHDLQEPLRMITSYSQLLLEGHGGDLDAEASVCVEFITEGTTRMSKLLTDLLGYTRLVNEEDRAVDYIDLNLIFEKALNNCKVAVDESQAIVTCERMPSVRGYEPHYLQLFQNLLSNALKYRDPARLPRVHFGISSTVADYRLSVQDNGIGIAPRFHNRIFEVFKRLHSSQIPGTGVGLATCKRVVERYGGRIWVESGADQGSTFYITLPVTDGGENGR